MGRTVYNNYLWIVLYAYDSAAVTQHTQLYKRIFIHKRVAT